MKIFKEDIDNIEKVDQINGDMPVVMADAKIDSQKNDKEADKRIETDLKKLANQKAFLGAKNQPVPDEPQMVKINLDEALFDESKMLDESISVAAVLAALKAGGIALKAGGKWLLANLDKVVLVLQEIGMSAEAISKLLKEIYDLTHIDGQKPVSESTITEAAPVAPKEHGLTDKKGNYYSDDDRSKGVDKKMKKDLWTIVYDELCPVSINIMNKTKFPNARLSDRYGATGRCYSDGEKITVYAKDEAGLRHAYDVADYYGIECTLPKKEFFKDPDKQVSCTLTVPVEGDY